ncbi:MAG: helicase-related protein [Bdellovibrionota bacterium]
MNYEQFLTNEALKTALNGKTATPLEVRMVEELKTGENIIIEATRDDIGTAAGIILTLADKSAPDARVLVITPSANDIPQILTKCEYLPIELEVSEADGFNGDGALVVKDGAPVILASFENAASRDLKALNVTTVLFLGFSSSARIPGSEAFENFLETVKELQVCFSAEAIPLTLNAAINRQIRDKGCKVINLEKEQEVQLSHEYYDIGHDLLAKPEALATLLETEEKIRAIVFCNSPSDTDLLEVILKKKGLKAKKLIGNIPDRAIHSTMDAVREGEINILILTDISGRAFPVEEFDMIVHYATPEDPEIYLHRLGQPDASSRLKRVVSLIGSMDLGNFHFLKKVVEFEFSQKSLPSAEDIARARFSRFEQEATAFTTEDAEIIEYADLIEKSSEQRAFTLYLLHQLLRKMPELESRASGKGGRGNRRSRDEEREDRRRGRDSEERYERDGEEENNRREREERPRPKPTRKDIRFYVGIGTDSGLTEDGFLALLKETMGESAPELKRSCLRGKYSFFDFEQKSADEFFEAMKDIEYQGAQLDVQKAAILSVPLDEEDAEDELAVRSQEEDAAEESETEVAHEVAAEM